MKQRVHIHQQRPTQLPDVMMNKLMMMSAAAFMLAAGAQAGDAPDFTNWTTESLHEIFIPTAHITYAHGKINTVTFPFRPKDEDGYPTKIYALDCFNLIFMFLFGPRVDENLCLPLLNRVAPRRARKPQTH